MNVLGGDINQVFSGVAFSPVSSDTTASLPDSPVHWGEREQRTVMLPRQTASTPLPMSPHSPRQPSHHSNLIRDGGSLLHTPRSSRRFIPAAPVSSSRMAAPDTPGHAAAQESIESSAWVSGASRRRLPENHVVNTCSTQKWHADTSKWAPHEVHPNLLTYHDGKKRWFHCSQCEYTNDRLYHTKMHFERIHVKQGRSMPRKRKYADPGEVTDASVVRSPNSKHTSESAPSATPQRKGESLPMETPPKGKGNMSNNKTTPSLAKNTNSTPPISSKASRGGKMVGVFTNGSAAGSTPSKASPSVLGKRNKDAVPNGTNARSCPSAYVSKIAQFDEHGSCVFTFGMHFFQDDGTGLALDVSKLPLLSRGKKQSVGKAAAATAGRNTKPNTPPKHAKLSASPKKKSRLGVHQLGGRTLTGGQWRGVGDESEGTGGGVVGNCDNKDGVSLGGRPVNAWSTSSTGRPGSITTTPSLMASPTRTRTSCAWSAACSSPRSSAPSSPHRHAIVAPCTPVMQRSSFGEGSPAPLRSPCLGDGMQALHGLPPGYLLANSTVPHRRQTMLGGGVSSFTLGGGVSSFMSAPDSCGRNFREGSADLLRCSGDGLPGGRTREGSSEIFGGLSSTFSLKTPTHAQVGYPSSLLGYAGGLESDLLCDEIVGPSFMTGP